MHAVFNTVPVGLDGLQAISRTHRGTVSYLAQTLSPDKIGKYPKDLAERTVRVLTHLDTTGAPTERQDSWLPWPTDHLPTGRPCSMFPPTRRSLI